MVDKVSPVTVAFYSSRYSRSYSYEVAVNVFFIHPWTQMCNLGEAAT